jgi:hypothetical protein
MNPGQTGRLRLHSSRIEMILFLACRTVMAAPPCDDQALDGSSTNQAGLRFAAVDAMLQLKESFFAVRVHVIGYGRTSESNGLGQNLLQGRVQLG